MAKRTLRVFCMVLGLGVLSLGQTLTAHPAHIPYPNPIKHVILVIQENRTPDNLFHGLLSYQGINPANYDLASSGLAIVSGQQEVIPLTSRTLSTDYDLGHGHVDFVDMWDNGALDGANLILDTCNANATDCQNQGIGEFLSYKYVQSSDVMPYLQMAAQWGWANYFFQTNQGSSFVAHQMLFSGTSVEDADDDSEGMFVAGNPGTPQGGNYQEPADSGCLAPLGQENAMITPKSAPNTFGITNNPIGTFCFEHDSMADLLDAAQLSWKYYVVGELSNPYPNEPTQKGYNPQGSMIDAPNSIYGICLPDYDGDEPTCTSSEFINNIDLNPPDVLTDIANCNLASAAWVTPTADDADHAGDENDTGGPSWVASIVNAIGTDTTCENGAGYWSDTAILVTWDDWGGWYDHVAPTIISGAPGDYELGFRVPLLVISGYTPQAYVSNLRDDFGSVLRFMQGVFNIPEGSLGFADARAQHDLSNYFNFNNPPQPFQQVNAPLNAEHFLHEPHSDRLPDTY